MSAEREGLYIRSNHEGTEVNGITIRTKFLRKPQLRDILNYQIDNTDGPRKIEFLDKKGRPTDYIRDEDLKNAMDFKSKTDFEEFIQIIIKAMKKAHSIRIIKGSNFIPLPLGFQFD
ncbi:MAG: hypothetical protein Q8P26_05730 [Candidatus Levybacteria bacterium]|nr:hypothetical protein [Candidatus Levybacteria bacterium]MDZ4227773.1 hypothetical protein [Candidatus Levybacteria bacterium]